MTPVEIHAWVVGCWQNKLVTAQVATPGPWGWNYTSLHMDGSEDGRIAPVAGGPAVLIAHFRHGGDAPHIVAFNPAFVIAVCQAALRRLARHAPTFVVDQPPIIWYCDQCGGERWPCPEIFDDVAMFLDYADFPEELRA